MCKKWFELNWTGSSTQKIIICLTNCWSLYIHARASLRIDSHTIVVDFPYSNTENFDLYQFQQTIKYKSLLLLEINEAIQMLNQYGLVMWSNVTYNLKNVRFRAKKRIWVHLTDWLKNFLERFICCCSFPIFGLLLSIMTNLITENTNKQTFWMGQFHWYGIFAK